MELKSKKNINVVLVEPEIPNNTGNIGRTCVALEATLHLVGPLGFDLEEKKLRRAGLDYWPDLNLKQYDSVESFLEILPKKGTKAFFTTKAERFHFDCDFTGTNDEGIWLIFGKETKGLSAQILESFPDDLYKIPMVGPTRSLNLANSVAIGVYEAFRQTQGL
jgi:tRNA (cytidine/uridine-2'-O-)-methyltransferase